MPLNFANIIALPFSSASASRFKIYYIMAWREGQTNLLQSVLTRAVTFSACTTATAFGSLWFSSHPGTSAWASCCDIAAHDDGGGDVVPADPDGQPREQRQTERVIIGALNFASLPAAPTYAAPAGVCRPEWYSPRVGLIDGSSML